MSEPTVGDVEKFWNDNPLFTGEVEFNPNQPEEFFLKHDATYFDDVFSGVDPNTVFYFPKPTDNVLDLGCGIGFWSSHFARQNAVKRLMSVDLTEQALTICKLRVPQAIVQKENAEKLSFCDENFDHVNCQGVIHHTPDTQSCINEIYRVTKVGGTASVSVYYRNTILLAAEKSIPIIKILAKLLIRDTGRGRDFSKVSSIDDIVRYYDGDKNPIGKAYTKTQFKEMLRKGGFEEIELNYFFFPFRFLKFSPPSFLRGLLVYLFPFMIVANLKK